jgi:hypothetical protein
LVGTAFARLLVRVVSLQQGIFHDKSSKEVVIMLHPEVFLLVLGVHNYVFMDLSISLAAPNT